MISSVSFRNFKALENYSFILKEFNILVGANNNGKSTVLDAFRVLQGAYRAVQYYKTTIVALADGRSLFGYEIPESSIPISIHNLQTNFSSEPAVIKFKFNNGNSLFIEFAPDSLAKMYFEVTGKTPRTPKEFRESFPLNLAVVPTLGPLESEEEILDVKYVARWHGSRRAPRLFRNYWYQNPELFNEFREIVERTWPGMSICLPERAPYSNELAMFYEENRIAREICWAGFGFQIWLQLLTHIISAKNADILIVDEPEIYLHPDLQHKILDLLKAANTKVVLATHSIEIIDNAEPNEVVLVDKKQKSAKRLSDVRDLQNVATILGSSQNIHLTRLARGKRILFVEGQDAKILTRFSKIIGIQDMLSSGDITIIPIEGFSQHTRITNTSWAFSKVLGEEIKLAALLDRDYRSDQEVNKISILLDKEIELAHILKRKEIENYFLIPTAIEKAINDRLKDRGIEENIDVNDLLYEATKEFNSLVHSHLMVNKLNSMGKTSYDNATIVKEFMSDFEKQWTNIDYRLCVSPGKMLFSKINEAIQLKHGVSITAFQVMNYIKPGDLDNDLISFLNKLQKFSTS